MSRKNVFNYQILPNLTSLSAGFVSNPTVVRNLDNVAYQINVTTTDSIGSFTVEAQDPKTQAWAPVATARHVHIFKRQSDGSWKGWRLMENSADPATALVPPPPPAATK